MAFSVVAEVNEHYAKFVVSGAYNLIAILGLTTQIKSEADDLGRHRILVDLRGVKGFFPDAERVVVGADVARVFGSSYRVSIVAMPEMINNIGKTAANSRGAVTNVFSTEEEAIRWLMRKDVDSEE